MWDSYVHTPAHVSEQRTLKNYAALGPTPADRHPHPICHNSPHLAHITPKRPQAATHAEYQHGTSATARAASTPDFDTGQRHRTRLTPATGKFGEILANLGKAGFDLGKRRKV